MGEQYNCRHLHKDEISELMINKNRIRKKQYTPFPFVSNWSKAYILNPCLIYRSKAYILDLSFCLFQHWERGSTLIHFKGCAKDGDDPVALRTMLERKHSFSWGPFPMCDVYVWNMGRIKMQWRVFPYLPTSEMNKNRPKVGSRNQESEVANIAV